MMLRQRCGSRNGWMRYYAWKGEDKQERLCARCIDRALRNQGLGAYLRLWWAESKRPDLTEAALELGETK